MVTLQKIFDESTALLRLFHARPSTKNGIKKLLEEVIELNDALVELDRHPRNFILIQSAAHETCDVIVTAINAYYARGGTLDVLEIAMDATFDKNRKKNETTHVYDGKSIKPLPNTAYISEGE
jgi:UV DNA damage repair endonuclease